MLDFLKEILNYFIFFSPTLVYFFGFENLVKYKTKKEFFCLNFWIYIISNVFYLVFLLSSLINYNFVLFFISIPLTLTYYLFKKSKLNVIIGYCKDALCSLLPIGTNFIIISLKLNLIKSILFLFIFNLNYFLIGLFFLSFKKTIIIDNKFEFINILLYTVAFVCVGFYGFKFLI